MKSSRLCKHLDCQKRVVLKGYCTQHARDMGDDTPPSRGSAVPSAGVKAEKPKKSGGEEPDSDPEPTPE